MKYALLSSFALALALPACGGGGGASQIPPASVALGGTSAIDAGGVNAPREIVAAPTASPTPITAPIQISITIPQCIPGQLMLLPSNYPGILLEPDCNIGVGDQFTAVSDNPQIVITPDPQPYNKYAFFVRGTGAANITITDISNHATLRVIWPYR